MIIGIDVSMINDSKAGIGYYTFSLVNSLIKLDKLNSYILYTNNLENLRSLTLSKNFKIKQITSKKAGISWIFNVVRDIKNENVNCFLSPSNLLFGLLFKNTITVVHDLSPIIFPQFFSRKGSLLFKIELDLLLRRKEQIVTGSDTIRKEILNYAKSTKCKVINLNEGIHEYILKKNSESEIQRIITRYGINSKYFLSVSTLEPRKNYINAIKAFSIFHKENPEYKYLIGGKKGWFYEEIFNTVKELGLEENVIFLGYVPEEDLISLYDRSTGFIYISFYEGFGLPLVEASNRNIPCLTSNIDVFKELNLPNMIYVDPNNVKEISDGMNNLHKMKVLKPFINSPKYTWDRVSEGFINIFDDFI